MSFTNPAIIAHIRTKIDAEFGPINSSLRPGEISYLDDYRNRLARIVAESGIYVRDNLTVSVNGVQPGGSTIVAVLT